MTEKHLRVGAGYGVWIFTMTHNDTQKHMKKNLKDLTSEQILEASAREAATDRALLLSQIEMQTPVGKEARGVVLGLASLFRDMERIDQRGASRLRWDRQNRERRQARPLCGARTRSGTPCKAKCVPGKARCRMHGGLSSGPKTTEGKAAIAESNRRRVGKGHRFELFRAE